MALDYNHAAHTWNPAPQPEFRRFYDTFLEWREANNWSNTIADELPEMFRAAGLRDVEARDEVESDFDRITGMWTHMTETLGPALIEAGLITEVGRLAARGANEAWRLDEGREITLALRAVTGRVPA